MITKRIINLYHTTNFFKMNKEKLKKALEIVKPGISNKELIEQTTSFAFCEGYVVTYNDEISISHAIPELAELTGAVPANELYNLLAKLKGDELEISVEKNEMHIKAGKAKVWIAIEAEIKLPLEEIIGHKDSWKPLPEGFNEAIKFVLPCCSNDMSKPILTCVNISEKGEIIASDGFRIAKQKLSKKLPFTTLIPAKSADQVIKLQPTKISKGKGWVHFMNAEETTISCRVYEEKFPDVEPFLKLKDTTSIEFPKTSLDIIDRASVFAKRDSWLDEMVTIELKDKKIKISSFSDNARFEEEANCRYSGEPLIFLITPILLKSILTKTHSCELNENRIKFSSESEQWEYLALLKEKDKYK